jgi:Transcriptional regulator, AbiEi antitoxin
MRLPPNQPSLETLLANQQNLVARPQLLACGVTDPTIVRRIRRGEWQRVLPGVYRVTPGSLTLEHRRIAAALFTGEDAQLTGPATLLWYGFTSPFASDRVHALIPHAVHRRSSGFVVVQRTHGLDPNARDIGLYRITSPARAVVDACRFSPDLRTVRAIMTEAIQRRVTNLQTLDREIRRAGRSRTALARLVLAEVIQGVRSAPEAEIREITESSTLLPEILWNPTLVGPDGETLPIPDGWIDEAKLGIEVDSRAYHGTVDGWDRTLSRGNLLGELGGLVMHFTPAEIRTEPGRVLRSIERAYLRRKGIDVPIFVKGRRPC